MNTFRLTAAALVLTFAACSSNQLPSSVRTVSVAPAARTAPVVLAPQRATAFTRMAQERNNWTVSQLRNSISRELAAGGRFQAKPSGGGDAEIAVESLRHGLIEVSANAYAVSIAGSVAISQGNKSLGSREFAGTSGQIRPLLEFEDPKNYEEAVQGVLDKVALELVSGL